MGEPVSYPIGEGRIELVEGDITRETTDAIVNAANSSLAGGGGVDGAVHRAAGPELMQACRKIGSCRTGSAVLTPGFRLGSRFVLHAVGPVWRGGSRGEADLLRSAYRTCLEIAARRSLKSIAFPSISTGAYGYPMPEAAGIALSEAQAHLQCAQPRSSLELIRFVLYGRDACEIFARAAEDLLRR
jgi:O-acetyl-ADP-ribose deacetylase (regulator of RNase III)